MRQGVVGVNETKPTNLPWKTKVKLVLFAEPAEVQGTSTYNVYGIYTGKIQPVVKCLLCFS